MDTDSWLSEKWAIEEANVSLDTPDQPFSDATYYASMNLATKLTAEEVAFISSASGKAQFKQTIDRRERLRHPNITQFLGVIISAQENRPQWFMTEKLENSLGNWIDTTTPVSCAEILDIVRQICLGLLFLHSKNTVHGQLGLDSVCIGKGNTAKLSHIVQQQLVRIRSEQHVLPQADIRALGGITINLCLWTKAPLSLDQYEKAIKKFPFFTRLLSSCFTPKTANAQNILAILDALVLQHKLEPVAELDVRKRGRPAGYTSTKKKQKTK